MTSLSGVAAAFEALAPDYDALFSDHPSGRIVRRAVWRVCDDAFAGADRVLDLGCGTGVDALHFAARGMDVVALDIAPRMVATTRLAAEAAGRTDRVAAYAADVGVPATWPYAVRGAAHVRVHAGDGDADAGAVEGGRSSGEPAPFDGALSDFGVLNCVGDLAPLGEALGGLIRPGGRFVAVVMGRACAWEIVSGLARGDVRRATRRWRGRREVDLGTGPWPVWYRSPRALARGLGPAWALERVVPIGALVPPTWAVAGAGALDRPWIWRGWAAAEAIASRLPTAQWWADHVAVVLRRRDPSGPAIRRAGAARARRGTR